MNPSSLIDAFVASKKLENRMSARSEQPSPDPFPNEPRNEETRNA